MVELEHHANAAVQLPKGLARWILLASCRRDDRTNANRIGPHDRAQDRRLSCRTTHQRDDLAA